VCSKAEDKLKGEKRREEMQNGVRASFKSWMNPSSKTKQQIVPGWNERNMLGHGHGWICVTLCAARGRQNLQQPLSTNQQTN
jgi:hypothetical protein